MGLFARDERESKVEEGTLPDASGAETRQSPRREPTPIDRERSHAKDREMTAHLGKGSRVTGKLDFEGPARVDGEVEGEISARDTLLVEDSAVVTAQIVGSTVIIKGRVTGNIQASERIEIRPPGRLEGDVATPTLIVHEGARFDGRCSMGGSEARAAMPKAAAGSEKRS
jgi:cytoskeletal protein CcmA (bactofilin family)